MKKIIASLLALSMMFSFWTFAHAEDENTTYSNAMNIMYDLGVVTGYDDGSLQPDKEITRMEFVTMALRLMGHYNVDESYATKGIFTDVPADLWGAKNINLACELGLVDGHTETEFAPNDKVTVNQAAKVLVCILGYKTIAEKQGYPKGYIAIGTDLSLFDNVGIGEKPATRDDVAKLMANALEAEMLKAKYQSDGTVDYVSSGKTLLLEMGIEKRKGVVYSVPGTDLGTGRILEEGQVIVGDVLYETTKTAIYDEIGSELEIWVVPETDSFVPAIVRYDKKATDTELTVSSYRISPATTTSEFVYLNDSNDRKTISLSNKTIFIYNGQMLTTAQVTADKLKPAMGYVTLKNYKDSDSPVVMIWDFDNYVVKSVKNGEIIYDSLGKKLEIAEDKTKTVLLDGQSISLENLVAGDILSIAVSPNGENYRIYVTRDSMDGTIEKVRTNSSGEIIYTIGGTDYYVARNYQSYVEANSTKVKELYTGDHTTFYLDYFGNIAYTDAIYELPSIKYGYVVDAEYDSIEEVLYVELMNDSNSFERFRVDPDEGSKLGIYKNGSYTVNKKNLTAVRDELIKDYGINRQIVKYNPSADGLLKEFYLLDTSGTSDIWGESRGNKTSMTYANGTLDGEFSIDANTIAFYVPGMGNDTKLYKSGRAVTLISSSASRMQLYDIIDGRVGVVVLSKEEKATTGYKYIIDMTNDPIMLVEEIATHVVDDEEVIYMSGWQEGKQVTVNFAKTLEKNSEAISTIEPGMLIQYKLNSDVRSRAETSDEPSRVILFRKVMDLKQPLEPFQSWNMKNDWQVSSQLRLLYGTIKSYSLPNMMVDCVEGEHSMAALSIDDSVNVLRWNRDENRGEKISIYDLQVGDMIFARTRYNVTKDIYIFE